MTDRTVRPPTPQARAATLERHPNDQRRGHHAQVLIERRKLACGVRRVMTEPTANTERHGAAERNEREDR